MMKKMNPIDNHDMDRNFICRLFTLGNIKRKKIIRPSNPLRNSPKNKKLRCQAALKLEKCMQEDSPPYFYD